MLVKTRVFELCDSNYNNLSELAKAMGISVSQIYRVREGKRNINQKFIVGAIKAFPERKFDDLFYFTPEPAAEEKQKPESPQQALEKFTSAIDEYAQHLKSHTSVLINLSETAQLLRQDSKEVKKLLKYLVEDSAD
jgi:transcriptional regulator with XRE-family HTH domain